MHVLGLLIAYIYVCVMRLCDVVSDFPQNPGRLGDFVPRHDSAEGKINKDD